MVALIPMGDRCESVFKYSLTKKNEMNRCGTGDQADVLDGSCQEEIFIKNSRERCFFLTTPLMGDNP